MITIPLIYFALFVAVVLEGEVALIAGSVAAHSGHPDILYVAMVACLATLIVDWSFFFAGRFAGAKILKRFKKAEKQTVKVKKLLNKYPYLIMFFYRYLYGLRIITLLMMGISRFQVQKFLLLSFASIVTWTMIFSLLGFYLGELVKSWMAQFSYPGLILSVPVMVIFAFMILLLTGKRMLVKVSGKS